MEKTGPFGQIHIGTDFSGHNPGKVGSINAVLQYILSITGPIFQAAQNFNKVRMDAADTAFHDSLFAGFPDSLVYIFLCLGHHFFNPGRMDTAIFDEAFQRQPCHFTANRIKAGQDDCFRRIIDDEIHAGQGFQCPNIPAFPSDDAALHFFIGQGNYGNRSFGDRIRRISLDRGSYDFPGFGICRIFGFFQGTPDTDCLFMGQFFIDPGKDHILGLLRRKLGDFLQLFLLFFVKAIQLFLLCFHLALFFIQLGFPLFQVSASPVQVILFLHQPFLILLQFIPALLVFLFHHIPKFVDFFPGLYHGFLFQGFRFPGCIIQQFLGIIGNLFCLFFRRSDSCFRNPFAKHVTDSGAYSSCYDASHDDV